MVLSGLPVPKAILPPLIKATPQSLVTPHTSASTRLLPLYHCEPPLAFMDVFIQNPTLKLPVTTTGKVPDEMPDVNCRALLLVPNRLEVDATEVSVPL